ncbi:beta-1,3-galactosyl-O-glycosyl-glycoprotein beta-1,6-N-acetylglucosaminyltransferase 3 [Erpetoichthys calabaricus]|uniref:beta-1,3-galactosyl-O-glycosyl-glycoprotein beta-1,6-N-acetylglucosaminyltransferase 3 n=1 Tax=Erpetoichthys calabaricus TaxID=27687 RepID=UPI0022342C11|nr:beta-1,3-galactosyl-O-glycosyl-glycoprotein beta-1,6-N-acetylglucosaminyltransferase 3 [Erpetoichthys calabaricus]
MMSMWRRCQRLQQLLKWTCWVLFLVLLLVTLHWSRKQICVILHLRDNSQMLFRRAQQDTFNCSRIIRGDREEIEHALLTRLLKDNKGTLMTEEEYLNMTVDCRHFVETRQFLTAPLSDEEEEFPIAYSMVVHEKIEMFERLLRSIYSPQNIYCVHVDQKSPEKYRQAVRAIVSCLPNVFIASKLERVVYASWSRVQADLNCMQDLLSKDVHWRYLINTCGTDFPIKTNVEIVQNLKVLNGMNSLESESPSEHKKNRWVYHYDVKDSISRTNIKKSSPPISSPMFTGNAYFVVSREFVEHLFGDKDAQMFIEWAKDTYSPDEHVWATLQRMHSVPGSMPPNDKFHSSDMNAIARLVKWEYLEGDVRKGSPYPRCTGTHRRAICVYGAGDLRWMLRQHHLFANKFDPTVDSVAIDCLEEYLRYKAIYGKSI